MPGEGLLKQEFKKQEQSMFSISFFKTSKQTFEYLKRSPEGIREQSLDHKNRNREDQRKMERRLSTITSKWRVLWVEKQEYDGVERGRDLRRGGGWE